MTECIYRWETFSLKVSLHFLHILVEVERIGPHLLVLKGSDPVLGIEPGSDTCQTKTLTSVLSFQPYIFSYLKTK